MKHNRIFVDLHVLQTVPPSCINRDDTGSPKTAIYGGAVRARVSSQAWKHAMRIAFRDMLQQEDLGLRTKKVVDMVSQEISKLDPTLDANKLAKNALSNAGIKIDDKKNESDALFFMSIGQAKVLAKLSIENCKDKKQYKEALQQYPACDIALFGRMVASDPSLNYDAAAQVAHAISTHVVHNEYDYFTAVDDLAARDNSGAGHLGTVEYNSSTMYRYATVNVQELNKNMGEVSSKIVRAFAEAFICSMPTGKQNTFANRTLPAAVYITVRRDQPVNLCGAFERPVVSQNGYLEASADALVKHAQDVYACFVDEPEQAIVIGKYLADLAPQQKLDKALDALENILAEILRIEVEQ